MSDWSRLSPDENGITTLVKEDGDELLIKSIADEAPALEANKELMNSGWDGYVSPSRDFKHVATIPPWLEAAWLSVGFDFRDRNNAKILKRILNSSEYAFLRTSPGRI